MWTLKEIKYLKQSYHKKKSYPLPYPTPNLSYTLPYPTLFYPYPTLPYILPYILPYPLPYPTLTPTLPWIDLLTYQVCI